MEVTLGGQHRARDVGNGGTELTLPLAGTGRGLKAGTHGLLHYPAQVYMLNRTSAHKETAVCEEKMWGMKGNELDRHIHQPLIWIWIPQFPSISVRNIRAF